MRGGGAMTRRLVQASAHVVRSARLLWILCAGFTPPARFCLIGAVGNRYSVQTEHVVAIPCVLLKSTRFEKEHWIPVLKSEFDRALQPVRCCAPLPNFTLHASTVAVLVAACFESSCISTNIHVTHVPVVATHHRLHCSSFHVYAHGTSVSLVFLFVCE
jgi:hypothetical protein